MRQANASSRGAPVFVEVGGVAPVEIVPVLGGLPFVLVCIGTSASVAALALSHHRIRPALTLPELGDGGRVLAQQRARQLLALLVPLVVAHDALRVLQHELLHARARHQRLELLVGVHLATDVTSARLASRFSVTEGVGILNGRVLCHSPTIDATMEAVRCRGAKVCSPFVDAAGGGAVFYVSAGSGEVFRWQGEAHAAVAFTGGEPLGAQLDQSGRLHVADAGHGAVLRVDGASSQPGVLVRAYEDRALRGPNGLAFAADGALFFTDSGPLGETTIEQPRGSVYCIASSPSGGQVLRPLALECLAHPWGIAVSSNPDAVFVAETMRNRVLRLRARPGNAYHTSVFHQFAGGMGPSCVACDINGLLYVGHYDFTGKCALTVDACARC